MKRLLFVVNVDWFFLSHRLPLALAAQESGFEVHVATTLTGLAQEISQYGFTVHPLAIDRRSAGLIGAARLVWSLRTLMRRLSPDVIHLVTIKPVLLGGLAARWARFRTPTPRVVAAISGLGFIFTARGLMAHLRRSLVALLYRWTLRRQGVYVIFQNSDDQALLQRYAGIRDEQVVRIRGSGVDLSTWPVFPLPEGAPIVLMAARLLVDKGVREFVQAARLVQKTQRSHAQARFVLVGDIDSGNPSSLSQEKIQAWVNEGLIEWWGPHRTRDMPEVIGRASLVVLPSYREGLPKVLIEAAASGRAVVTTDVPGCRDAIDPGHSGLLVPARDAVALAQAIQGLLDQPEQLRAMGAAGRRLAEKAFDVREVIARHLKIYLG
jgi:glycosyltransferase involved in cell wall biosynthesis